MTNKNTVINIVLVILFIFLFFFVLAPFYGIIPLTSVNSLAIMFGGLGSLDCLTKMGLCVPYTYTGLPLGSYILGGLPFVYIASISNYF